MKLVHSQTSAFCLSGMAHSFCCNHRRICQLHAPHAPRQQRRAGQLHSVASPAAGCGTHCPQPDPVQAGDGPRPGAHSGGHAEGRRAGPADQLHQAAAAGPQEAALPLGHAGGLRPAQAGAAPAEAQVRALGIRVHMILHPWGHAPMGAAPAEAQAQAVGIRVYNTPHLRVIHAEAQVQAVGSSIHITYTSGVMLLWMLHLHKHCCRLYAGSRVKFQ